MKLQALKAAIMVRFGSIHAFCRCNPALKRSTVYMVLGGRYPGRAAPQVQKIQAALEGPAQAVQAGQAAQETPRPPLPTAGALGQALQAIRCRHCRRLDKSRCGECRAQTLIETQELITYLAGEA